MKVGSLFSGYGGLDLAVGGDLAWYSEIEPAACKVMEAHYPGVPNLGDITQVDWADVEPVDVITGGYPCQPFSNAGMRKGKDDERHLWPHVRDAISAIRPRRAVLENVRGHLTLGFEDVLADLAALGLSARWGVVRAADAGAPHNRARLFIVAINPGHDARGTELREQSQESSERATQSGCVGCAADAAGDGGHGRPDGHDAEHEGTARLLKVSVGGNGSHVTDADSASGQAYDDGRPRRRDARRPQPLECGGSNVADAPGAYSYERPGLSSVGRRSRQAEQTGVGNFVVANPSSERHGGGQGPTGLGRMGGETEGSRRQTSTARQESGAGSAARWGDYAPAIERWEHVTGRPAPAATVQRAGRDRLNPVFVEWMMGLPEGWVTGHGLSASQELKMLGNGVVPQQAALALRLLGAA